MREFIKIFTFLLATIYISTPSYGLIGDIEEGATCCVPGGIPGCPLTWTGDISNFHICKDGLYCDINSSQVGVCKKCSDLATENAGTGTWTKSDGSDSKVRLTANSCYINTCTTLSNQAIAEWKPDSDKIYYPSTECTYTIAAHLKCRNEDNKCSGYHKITTPSLNCVSNKETISLDESSTNKIKKYNHYYNGNSWETKKYPTECYNDSFLYGKETNCGTEYTQCATSAPCDNATEGVTNCPDATNTGTISGNITATPGTTTKNFSNCICQPKDAIDIPNGTALISCPYNTATNSWSTSCSVTQLKTCVAGYCQAPNNPNGLECLDAPQGYYHPDPSNTDTKYKCSACPTGSTSDTSSSAKSDCYLSPQTKIKDKHGNVSLPIPSEVKIHFRVPPTN